jgi:hypothetical protein
MAATTSVKAALRDASWYANPSGHGWNAIPPKYHVVVGSGPACNPNGVLIAEDTLMDAADVEDDARCQRPGCRRAWRDLDEGS